ncbi:MAG: acetyl-CoA C-acetyltransferase [Pseudomonadota bacterium]
MPEAYIYDAVRTPRGRGKPDGALHQVPPIRLATTALNALRDRLQLDTANVDDVILGVVSPVGEQGSNIARVAAIDAGYAQTVAGVQVNRFCASGLEAVNMAAGQVMSGQSDLVVGGGVESMSRIPMSSAGGAWYADPQVAFHSHYVPQGISADLIASLYGYSRADVDGFAAQSQARAAQAWEEKRFARSVAPVYAVDGQMLLDHDEHRRPGTTADSLAKLPASFEKLGADYGFDAVALQRYPQLERIEHVHHAGNSSGIVDGAAAVLIGNRETGERLGLKPRARIRAFASIGSEPTIMLTGPAPATQKVLKRAGMSPSDIDLYEVNEAFAAVVLRFADVVGVPMDRINVNGGAIALGHPLGATGAILIATVLDELERRGQGTGLATLCIGAGMGTATIIERL